ncbi:hypothetical protein E3N88_04545 [Mikania micrantha]|uniref:Uncharacterized protein n=1 Tax=Mikania micrantha TaxID=192012 RepID=A0A5N6PW36_9ASTR|nr:hypothetical protein E3N88_04545 [Mikania micrantha]
MGFGKLLYLDIEEIPSKLGYFVVDCFDCNNMEMLVGSHKVKVDSKAINRLLGIPKEGLKLILIKRVRKLSGYVATWRIYTKAIWCFTCPGINIDTKRMPVEFCTPQMLKIRERLEIENGGFGLGELRSMCNVIKDPGKNVLKNGEKLQALKETPRPRRRLFTISV